MSNILPPEKPISTSAQQHMEDVHRTLDTRQIAINKVGIKDVRYPCSITNKDGSLQNTVATFSMFVDLPHDQKGTHMSRFNAVLNNECNEINLETISLITAQMTQKLEASSGFMEIKFPFFIKKAAPITGVTSMMDYEATLNVTWKGDTGESELLLKVQVPVTSLCPCSKKISDYGAHNQRSHVTVSVKAVPNETVWIEEIIETIEQQASCEIYGLLKRADEKFVTEKAYNTPKFVEDMVRDVASQLDSNKKIAYYLVETENFESIHNHSAYALIEKDKTQSI